MTIVGAGIWPALVLFDRDGTLVEDVPYNGDSRRVVPRPGAAEAVATLRSRGIHVGVITNQSAVGAERISREDVESVNREVDRQIGPIDLWRVCPHTGEDGCGCRKPEPGMVMSACAELDITSSRCVVIGDRDSDVLAAAAAGASGLLLHGQVGQDARARETATRGHGRPELLAAVDAILGGRW